MYNLLYATVIFYLFDSCYNQTLTIHCENRSVRFCVSFENSYCFKLVLYPPSPLIFMNRLFMLSVRFESTVNDILGHAYFRIMAIFNIRSVIRFGNSLAFPC